MRFRTPSVFKTVLGPAQLTLRIYSSCRLAIARQGDYVLFICCILKCSSYLSALSVGLRHAMGSSAAKLFFCYTLEYPVLPQDMMGLYPTQLFVLCCYRQHFIQLSAHLLVFIVSSVDLVSTHSITLSTFTVVKFVLAEPV
jgi:hypothetical protein